MKQRFTISIIFVLFLYGAPLVIAQKSQSFEDLIKIGTLEVYDNPKKAISIGSQIAFDSLNNIDQRIKGMLLISKAYSSKRDYQSSLSYAIKAKELLTRTNDPLIHISVIDRIAIQYHQLGIFDKALDALNESEKLSLSYPIKDSVHLSLGNNYAVRGFIYRDQLNCEIALGYFNKSISEYKKIDNSSIKANWSIVLYNKGNCHILLSDYQKAKENLIQSVRLADEISAQSLRAFAQKGLAEVLTLEGKYEEAILVLEEAKKSSDKVGDLVLNRGIYRGLSQNYLALNNWEKYQEFNSLHLELQLTIKESERTTISNSINDSVHNYRTSFEQKKPTYLYGIFGMILACIMVVFSIYLSERNTKKRIKTLLQKIKLHQK